MKIYIDQNGTNLCSEEHFTLNVVLEPFSEKQRKKRIEEFGINTENDWIYHIPFPRFTPTEKRARILIDLPYMPHIKQAIRILWIRLKQKLSFSRDK